MYIAALWIGMAGSLLPRKWLQGREARRWRSGRHWRKTSGGAEDSLGSLPGSPTAPAPSDSNADVPAAAANDAGGRNSDQSVGD